LPVRAASARRRISVASSQTLRLSALRMTGTIRPFGVCVAMPMWTRRERVMTFASSS
jgi:hypothetical protein